MTTEFPITRQPMDSIKISLTILSILFLFPFKVIGQPCGPKVRLMDRQTLTANGDILLLNSRFAGDLMMVGKPKGISLNYVLISDEGKIKKDASIYLEWPEWHYDFMSCHANYKSHETYNKANSREDGYNCATYMLYSQGDKTVLGYFLAGDRKFAYEIIINKSGKSKWKIYNFDNLDKQKRTSSNLKFSNDSTKVTYWYNHLKEKHNKLLSLPKGQYDYNAKKRVIKIKNSDIYLSEIPYDTLGDTLSQLIKAPNKWRVKGKGWELTLDGSIFENRTVSQSNPPLVTVKNNFLYVTVFNMDSMSCPGYGWDVTPIVYCIDISKGTILWKQTLP